MESLIAVVVAVMLMIFTGLTLFESTVRSQEELMTSWQLMEHRLDDQTRTSVEILGTNTTSGGEVVEVTLRNNGSTRLTHFEDWDIVFQYQAPGSIVADWYPYTPLAPSSNEWGLQGIYVDTTAGSPEVIEPGIINPGEEFVLHLRVSPGIQISTTNQIVITTDNGVNTSAPVIR